MNPRNIDWLGGAYYADLKVKGGWESKTLRLKTLLFSASGFTNYSLRMEYGRKSFATSMWDPKPFLKFIETWGLTFLEWRDEGQGILFPIWDLLS